MKAKYVMMIAGETSGDALAAELVRRLQEAVSQAQLPSLEFIGAGGAKMAEAGVKLAVDMTQHAVTGLSDVLKKYSEFKKIFEQLLQLALEREPDLIVLVDFGGFNLRFAKEMRRRVEKLRKDGGGWSPKIVQFVSPQVWASRAGRAKTLESNVDLLLCLFPFEKKWYAEHAPKLRVEFVGHPILDRHLESDRAASDFGGQNVQGINSELPLVLLLPGSRSGELKRHLPVMEGVVEKMRGEQKVRFRMVLPSQRLMDEAARIAPGLSRFVEIQTGDLTKSLKEATVAIASTGTVLLECACLGVPTVAMYKTSWGTYQIGKRLIKVRFLSMPNLLADAEVFPEFIQENATVENISRAVTELMNDEKRREGIRSHLKTIVKSLGEPGAAGRAAQVVLKLMNEGSGRGE